MEDHSDIIIKKDKYVPALEEKVKYYVQTIPRLPVNDIVHERAAMSDFDEDYKVRQWQVEEIRRCKEGYKNMCGKMYFYFNYGNIQDIERGMIHPDYRVADADWFQSIEDCQESREWGLICVKRRRAGFSWKEAADVLHDCTFNPFFVVGMNSKTERDSVELFKKVKFMYDNLPPFIRANSSAGNTKMGMFFGYKKKDKLGNMIKRGTQSEMIVVPPTDTAYEGLMLNKVVMDEAGKVPNLPTLWSYTKPCLMVGPRRSGLPVIFGTSGEVGKEGRGLKQMWDDAEAHKLVRKFFGGWMGFMCDKYGNDMIEDAVRWIIYERDRLASLSAKELNDFIQQYPLTVEEAFAQASEGGVGDIMKITKQMSSLSENPPVKKKGWFRPNSDGSIDFVPDSRGSCIIYEEPKHAMKNNYIAGGDPVDHDNTGPTASAQSLYIVEKQNGPVPPHIVFEYTDKPAIAKDFYKQTLYALMYYNNTKILIENNRWGMIQFFQDEGYGHLLHTTPQGVLRLIRTRVNTIGVKMTEPAKAYLKECIEDYVWDYCEYIPSKKLLQEFIEFGSTNTDRAMAFGVTLMLLKEDTRKTSRADKYDNRVPNFGFKKINGRIVRIDGKSNSQK